MMTWQWPRRDYDHILLLQSARPDRLAPPPPHLPDSRSLHFSSLSPCVWGINWIQQARRMCGPAELLHNAR